MIRSNTRRQIYLGLTVASYLYFLGDAAVNYRYDASPVKKATTLATIFPGAGQVYNKSYWKLPFVVGGLATTIYTIDWNNRGYKRFKKALPDRSAYDKAWKSHQKDPEHHPDPPVAKGEFGTKYSAEFLKNLKDNYRRNRDLCIIITAGLYVLQIIDAHVDAHLKKLRHFGRFKRRVHAGGELRLFPDRRRTPPDFRIQLQPEFLIPS